MLHDCVKTEQSTGATVRCFPSKLGARDRQSWGVGGVTSLKHALWATLVRPDLLDLACITGCRSNPYIYVQHVKSRPLSMLEDLSPSDSITRSLFLPNK